MSESNEDQAFQGFWSRHKGASPEAEAAARMLFYEGKRTHYRARATAEIKVDMEEIAAPLMTAERSPHAR